MELSILEWSLRALLMAGGTGLVVSALRVRGASLLHRAWTAALVAMLLLPVWTQWGPSVTARVLPAAPVLARFDVPAPEISLSAVSPQAIPPQAERPLARIEANRLAPHSSGPNWQMMLLTLYLAGFAGMLLRLIAGTVKVRSMMRQAREADGFATSPLCAAPVTIGWIHPILLLPDCWRAWPAGKLEAVLLHERAHIRRRDPLVQWLALLNRCVFWFHPVAWWLERKLAALAEEACDAAVLDGGHAPHDYARYLIEIARSVNIGGARVRWAGAVAFSDGKLPRRIRRIMDAAPATTTSRAKSIASASLCALLLTTFLACNLGRPSGRVPGQITMAEQERRERARMDKQKQEWERRAENAALWNAVLSDSPKGAEMLSEYVKAHPGDRDNLQELVQYYQSRKDLKSLDALTLWFIGHHPEVRTSWGLRPEWDEVRDRDEYESGSKLWTEQLGKSWENPFVYMNAAEFFAGTNDELAEQILWDGRRRFPPTGQYSGLHWEVFLARLYAWALTGSSGQWPADRNTGRLPDTLGQGAYVQKVRANLLASNDAELLDRTVEQLQSNRPNLEFTRALIGRMLSIKPDDRTAHVRREALERFDLELRVQKDPGTLSDTDRMALLQSQLVPQARARADAKDSEAKARELLALASHNTKDPNYGTSVFLADMTLADAAFDRGDKHEAVRLLLAASEAPLTEYLRYNQIDMSLPGKLVDAGEREAAATFLDRCAKFNKGGTPLAQWAAQIRKGINPRLMPEFDVFRQDRLRKAG